MAKVNMPLPWSPNWSPDGRWWLSLEEQNGSQGSERLALFGFGTGDEVNHFGRFGRDGGGRSGGYDYCHTNTIPTNTIPRGDDSFLLH